MRLTRSLEERLVNLYRQTKVVGGLFRSLGQEADAVGSAYALERGDILSPLIRNLGSMLVKGATPVEILKQYMAKGDSPTRGRELNIHFGDTERGFIGQISPLGDMVPVMAGVTLTLQDARRGSRRARVRRRRRDVDRRVPRRDQLRRRAALPARRGRREQRLRVLDADARSRALATQFVDKAIGYGIPGEQADGNDVIATYDGDEARRRSRAARRGRHARRADDLPPEGARRARQPVVRAAGRDRAVGSARTIRSRATSRVCATSGVHRRRARGDRRARRARDRRGDRRSPSSPACPKPLDALDRRVRRSAGARSRSGSAKERRVVETHERPEGWGTFDAPAEGAD